MKKMTAKEFKEILEMANINTDFVSILTTIANHEYDESKEFEAKGYKNGARSYMESFEIITNELVDRGYVEF